MMASEDSTKGLISTREQTHGPFDQQSEISQALKNVYYKYHTNFGKDTDPIVDEAIEMILHKISRIAAGNYYVKEHWDDIAGYAQLPPKFRSMK
jgi:hypothetical protein